MDIEKLLKSLTLEEKLGQLTQLNAVFFKEEFNQKMLLSALIVGEAYIVYIGLSVV